MDRDAWDASVYGVEDTWIGGTFNDIDADGDGFVTSQELYDWEHNVSATTEETPIDFSVFVPDFDADNNPIWVDPDTGEPVVDPVTGEVIIRDTSDSTGTSDPTDTTGTSDTADTTGTSGTSDPTDTTGTTDSTDPADTTGTSDTADTTDTTGDADTTDTTGSTGTGDTTGTTGTGDTGTDGDGTTGDGTNGDGNNGSGTNGSGGGPSSVSAATRTTDSLFKDMLTLKTKVGSTQGLLSFNPYVPQQLAPAPLARTDILQQFLNQQRQPLEAPARRQGMLTDAQPPKRFPY